MILSLDPGIRGTGAAIINETTKAVIRAAYITNPVQYGRDLEAQYAMAFAVMSWAGRGLDPETSVLVAELMQVYPPRPGQKKSDPNVALLPLVGVIGHVSGMRAWGERVQYRPHEWKGSINGDAFTQRILGRLSPTEVAAIEPCSDSVRHNAIDAIGIGLHRVGRMAAKRVIRR